MRLKDMLRLARTIGPPVVGILFLSACSDSPQGLDPGTGEDSGIAAGPDGGTITGTGPYCDVMREVFLPYCSACHYQGAGGTVPDLSYAGGRTSIINIMSTVYAGQTYVVPGSPQASFLYRKVSGDLQATEGARMPSGSALSGDQILLVQRWIADGASLVCDQTTIDVDAGVGRVHPVGFNDPSVHGTEMKMQAQDCRTCHGADLTGGIGPSCDSCHQAGWRTNCTYCHGGTDSTLGAPPRDLSGVVDTNSLTFRAHTQHTTPGHKHPVYDCTQCHTKPENVLSVGHAFDDTPGHSEVNFTAGLSGAGAYPGGGACNNLYCHGNGRGTLGMYSHDQAEPACGSCHPTQASGSTAWRSLSGDHRTHLVRNVTCDECHSGVVNANSGILDENLHVDGAKSVVFTAAGFTRTNGRCSGSCHNERHTNRTW